MNQTTHYQLSHWESTDRIQMADFNSDNQKIDAALKAVASAAGNCKIVTGSYVGNGDSGKNNPCTLTFDFQPLLVFMNTGVADPSNSVPVHYILTRPCATVGYSSVHPGTLTWGEQSVSWYNTNATSQLNVYDQTYHYIAIGIGT